MKMIVSGGRKDWGKGAALFALVGGMMWPCQRAAAGDEIREALATPVLAAGADALPSSLWLYASLTNDLAQARTASQSEAAHIGTPEALAAWQKRVRPNVISALGGFPGRTPLEARVAGVVQRDGYRVEKILFESRPGFYVTALLFLPDANRFAPPYPGILVPCGHSDNGKALPGYQRGALLAAVNGMAALLYDPIDQGERGQGVGKGGTTGHNVTGVSAALLGLNTATFRIWDGMRALDYLASRPEVDAKRLGCMGNSGGGTLTAYLSALDERVAVSAPSCFISSFYHVCAAFGLQDAEQNLYGQMAFGLEHAGWLMLRATKPTAVVTKTKDFFPIEGARETAQEIGALYGRLGAADRFVRLEDEGPHGWSEPNRVGSVRWMSRWLRASDAITVPPESDMGLDPKEANVTPQGQVLKVAGARSVYDLLRDEAARLAAARKPLDARGLREAVRVRAGVRPLAELPEPAVKESGATRAEGFAVRRFSLIQAGGVPVSAVLFTPDVPKGAPALVVDGFGKTNAADAVAALLKEGRTVLAADLVGFGETFGGAHRFYGAANPDEGPAVMAYLLGRSLVGMRAEDVLMCARWLSARCGGKAVDLHAANWAVTPALHAAVSEPQAFGKVVWTDAPTAWEEVVQRSERHRFSDIVNGALRSYTTGDLKAAASDRK